MLEKLNPMVSIIIPVYNGSNYLREAIDSALAQTYKNIEIIVVNDGSIDNGKTEEIASSYGDKIRYFKKNNGGVATALNLGIEKMKGDYFSWLSHDDLYYPEKIANQIEILAQMSEHNVILYTDYLRINEKGNEIEAIKLDTKFLAEKPLYALLRAWMHGCSLIIPKRAFLEYGLFDEKMRTTQDYDLWFKMRHGYKFVHVPQILIKSRFHSEQDSKRNPVVLIEANDFWKRIYNSLSEQEILSLEKSRYTFLKGMVKFLEETPYEVAVAYYRQETNNERIRLAMNFKPLVSIVIPVYNGANYVREAIESALVQTYTNIEILVINDGSTDNGETERIAHSYGDKIRYFAKENGGTSTALNLGIREMKGEYFSWLSHDDTYYPDKIERQILELSKLDDKNTIMMSDLDGIDENYNKIYETNFIRHINAYPPRENSRLHPIVYNQTHGCTLLISKTCFDEVGLFDEKELVAQDFEFFYRAFAKFPHKLISKVLVTARDSSNRQGRRSKSCGNKEYSKLYIRIIENLSDEEIKLLAPNRLEFYSNMASFFREAEYSIALEYINKKMLSNLQISSYDLVGNRFNGHDLHFYLRDNGIDSKQLVLHKLSDDISTFAFDFNAPNSSKELLQQRIFLDAELVHLHLIHNIIDVNYLPLISKLKPTILTLHDPFFLGGHCVHHFDCMKWKTHCADCAYLDKDFILCNDISALNFALKKAAIQNSEITAIVASKWMKNKVEESPIWKGKKVYYLPFGIDQNLFKPGDMIAARKKLNIPFDDIVLMFRCDILELKGLDIIINALMSINCSKNITLIAVGKTGMLQKLKDKFKILEYDWINNNDMMVSLYQASDVFLMPSRQETFGLMAIEAMSCGKMVLVIKGDGTALPEIVNFPDCGIAVEETNFSKELARLVENKPEIVDRGKKCADYARVTYSKDTYVNEIIRIYREVVDAKEYDDETKLLLRQLKKHHSDTVSIGHVSNDHVGTIIAQSSMVKRTIRFFARKVWGLIKVLNLKPFIKSTHLYSRLREKGIIDKLKG